MATAPFDNLTTVLYAVRARMGDAIESLLPLGGQILGNNQYAVQQYVNNAWRKLQEYLVSRGCVLLQPPPVVIAGFGIVNPVDPSIETYVDWSGYFNGTTVDAALVLPQDLIEPIEVQERVNGSGSLFTRMDLILGAMPAVPQTAWNGSWQWRQNKLVLPGTTVAFDLRISYAGYFADFNDTGDVTTATGFVPWYSQPVPIMRAFDSLACYICAEIEIARGNSDAAIGYTAEGKEAAGMIMDKDYMRVREPVKTADVGVPPPMPQV